MTTRLHRYYGTHDLHFITSRCYRRQPELGSAWRRDLFVKILEEARRKYRFVVHGLCHARARETGPVRVRFQEWSLEIKRRPVESFAEVENPVICKVRK